MELLIWLKRKVWKYFFQIKEPLKITISSFLPKMELNLKKETTMKKHLARGGAALAIVLAAGSAPATADPMANVDRNGSIVSVEPYGPGIVHVTIAIDHAAPAPGYGISGKPDAAGWTHRTGPEGDVFASPALTVTAPGDFSWYPVVLAIARTDSTVLAAARSTGARLELH